MAAIQEAIQHVRGGYDVVPENAGAEQELSQTGKEHWLKEAVAPLSGVYTKTINKIFRIGIDMYLK